jgi:hypothetical protein
MAAPTIEQLKQRLDDGYALNEAAIRRIAEAEEAERIERAEQGKAKRITDNLNAEPTLRAETEEALADLRGLLAAIGPAIEKSIELRDRHEALARMLRHDGERCPAIPSLKVQGIQDRALFHDLDRLRICTMRDF